MARHGGGGSDTRHFIEKRTYTAALLVHPFPSIFGQRRASGKSLRDSPPLRGTSSLPVLGASVGLLGQLVSRLDWRVLKGGGGGNNIRWRRKGGGPVEEHE